ncbi:hypothetical protein [uncultured Microbulbifer sp.]|uniref:hypothetical protein n=1 Tax=uncultured Microbulbifer sp. TaxID=348147 RepID=UPI002617DB30|nr:hypothetical protein [uncultured Microbulbifer sp.]
MNKQTVALLVHELCHGLVRTALAPIKGDVLHILLDDRGGLCAYQPTGDPEIDTACTAAGPIGEILHHAEEHAVKIASRILWQPWTLLTMCQPLAPEDHEILQQAHSDDSENFNRAVRLSVLLTQSFVGDGAVAFAAKQVAQDMGEVVQTGVLLAHFGNLGRQIEGTQLLPLGRANVAQTIRFDHPVTAEATLHTFTPPDRGDSSGQALYRLLTWQPQPLPSEFNESFENFDRDRV